ncbi:MAG: dehydrogenase E1 component subunit alpha/beta [Rhodothermales bacterium]
MQADEIEKARSVEDARAQYRALLLPRVIEEKMLRLIRQGRLSKWFSGYGQEAIAVGCTLALEERDYILPMHRNLGVWTTRGLPLESLFCQLMGKAGGYTQGRDRTFHFGVPEKRLVGMISHLAAMLPVACGLGLASQLAAEEYVALAFIGEGASREGDFHEAVNLASVWKLPVIFVVENNQYGLSTPTADVMAGKDFASAAAGYGLPGIVVDGNDLPAVMSQVGQAAERGRAGEGPTLLEMVTFRMRGHEEASGTKYVPPELMTHWAKKDPVARFERRLLRARQLTKDEMAAIRKELETRVEAAAEFALAQPEQVSAVEREVGDVYAPAPPVPAAAGGAQETLRFVDAVRRGLWEAMEADDRLVLMGQDIAEYGGVFKVTEGFVERFGKARVRNTPIIESGAIGAALGLSLAGYRPVVEMQYADFISCGFNQIVNNLATTHYRWGAPVPVTIRAPFGGGIGAGPFHSQSLEAWFTHVPGLKVVIPATPADARGLLRSAIDDPNPVLYLEHKLLYRSLKAEMPAEPHWEPLGKARIAREGRDATIVTYGVGVHWALEAASAAERNGHAIEVIDLRTLVPWDRETVLASVRKTNRVLVLHEAGLTGGFGGELCATIAQEAFTFLDAPPMRVGSLDTPIPFSTQLEKELYSAKARLPEALDLLLRF